MKGVYMLGALMGVSKIGKIALAAGASALIFELATCGCEALRADAGALKDLYNYKTNPEPHYAKKNKFLAKKEVVKINPITGSISPYHGTRRPASKSIIRY